MSLVLSPTAVTLLVLGLVGGVFPIAVVVVIEIRAHRARRDRISPIIRRRVAERTQRKAPAL